MSLYYIFPFYTCILNIFFQFYIFYFLLLVTLCILSYTNKDYYYYYYNKIERNRMDKIRHFLSRPHLAKTSQDEKRKQEYYYICISPPPPPPPPTDFSNRHTSRSQAKITSQFAFALIIAKQTTTSTTKAELKC